MRTPQTEQPAAQAARDGVIKEVIFEHSRRAAV